ncbi:hypothetical protein HYFRA_00000386 [Hymenoscyphus fraxineus]|uniref:RING-type domain-containing protein n=1 Tax=Hymenoscyphus fraxineus TaxID=746836 RepID=A0A9N9PXV4_9HELO|nr:hypothetical protein HYFRA_00000386 [Hymenoscyphus fraxineus]
MCRAYLLRCGTCKLEVATKYAFLVNCRNGQQGCFQMFRQNTNTLLGRREDSKPFKPCDELERKAQLFFAMSCPYCYAKDEVPSADEQARIEIGERLFAKMIADHNNRPLLYATGLHPVDFDPYYEQVVVQRLFRVRGEKRRQFDELYSAAVAYYSSTSDISGAEAHSRNPLNLEAKLMMLLESISMLNLVADKEEEHGYIYTGEDDIPLLLRDLELAKMDDKDCNICGDEMGKETPENTVEYPVETPCRHVFGSGCIIAWLEESQSPTCPMCRRVFSTKSHRFPDAYYDNHPESGFGTSPPRIPHDWLEILVDAAAPTQYHGSGALDSAHSLAALNYITGDAPIEGLTTFEEAVVFDGNEGFERAMGITATPRYHLSTDPLFVFGGMRAEENEFTEAIPPAESVQDGLDDVRAANNALETFISERADDLEIEQTEWVETQCSVEEGEWSLPIRMDLGSASSERSAEEVTTIEESVD